MKLIYPFRKKKLGGVSAGLLITSLVLTFSILSINVVTIYQQRNQFALKDWNKIVVRETARSSFILMEAALKRRLWEPPPDNNCLRSKAFGLSGTSTEGATFQVQSSFDATNKIFNMYATSTYQGTTSVLFKSTKVLDASDFLIFSQSTEPTLIQRNVIEPLGVIAGKRRLYLDGTLSFTDGTFPQTQPTSWGGYMVPRLPHFFGLIFQAERFQALGGLHYHITDGYNNSLPLTNFPVARAAVSPYYQTKQIHTQGAAVITNDFSLATSLYKKVAAYDAAWTSTNFSLLQNYVYPKSLACGSFPIMAQTAQDTGCYIKNINQWKVWLSVCEDGYSCGGDHTCMMDKNIPEDQRKICSSSEHFPKGFKQWVADANMTNVVLGSESQPLDFGQITWDNFEALREDALSCGVVVGQNNNDGSYEDCDLGNEGFQKDYAQNGNPPCQIRYKLDAETLSSKLNNFNPAVYGDASKKDYFMRRVIYSEDPLEIEQSQRKGLWTGLPQAARENASFWFVNEDKFILKPNQPTEEQTSPLVSNIGNPRKIFFNADPDTFINPKTELTSLKMVMLSPELVEIISPFHKPYTNTELVQAYPRFGNKIRPRTHIYTDHIHQEDDGFKYGVRNIYIKNIGVIQNQKLSKYSSNPHSKTSGFRLKGLWGGVTSGTLKVVRNLCMFDVPGNTSSISWQAASVPFLNRTMASIIPNTTYVNNDPFMPSTTSIFYRSFPGGARGAIEGVPNIFWEQYMRSGKFRATLNFSGVKVSVNFDSTIPTGKRDLSDPKYKYTNILSEMDLGDRRVSVLTSPYYNPINNQPCVAGNVIDKRNGQPAPEAISPFVNIDWAYFSQSAPDQDFTELGSLFSVDLPTVEVR